MRKIQGFRGEQFAPEDAGYDEARTLFNAMVDKRPAVIARCASRDDVALAIAHGRAEGAEIAVLGGGHSVAGASLNDGGLVIDMRAMKDAQVDPARRRVLAGAGLTWGELDRITQQHGLATTGGRVSTTGIVGFTLGGGSGWLERGYGLACDNLVGAELVTATGDVVHVSADEHPDLLWALRGGGGNFGVVTAIELRLHECGPVIFGGLAAYDPVHARELARAFRDFHDDAPEAAGLALVYLTAPPEDFIPAEWHGKLMFAIAGMYNAPPAEAEEVLRPLLDRGPAVVNLFGPMPYADLQCMIDDPPGNRNWWTADYLRELPDEAIEAFCSYSESMPRTFTQSLLVRWGGAVARASVDETPLARRDAGWVVHPFGVWPDASQDAEHLAWGRRSHEVFAPWATGGTYLNFIGDEGQDRIRASFGEAYDRLVEIKTRWDPDNVFHGNQNIRPATRAGVA
jgi:FAD/FMN-containing dehydrogenase